jgi:hypothetical protein
MLLCVILIPISNCAKASLDFGFGSFRAEKGAVSFNFNTSEASTSATATATATTAATSKNPVDGTRSASCRALTLLRCTGCHTCATHRCCADHCCDWDSCKCGDCKMCGGTLEPGFSEKETGSKGEADGIHYPSLAFFVVQFLINTAVCVWVCACAVSVRRALSKLSAERAKLIVALCDLTSPLALDLVQSAVLCCTR